MTSISIVAFIVAVTAAIRSTWSPCGVSMLSTITPLAERSRGRRYGVTASWFVLGAVFGGLGLGVISALGAAAFSLLSLSGWSLLCVAAACALVAAAVDSGVAGPGLPHHRRQVNELWLDRYRGWVYGVGFGAQIGFGLATFIMTAAVYLTVALGALTGRPLIAVAVGATFGLVRGLVVVAGAGLTTPDRLRVFHERFEAWRQPVARWTVLIECSVAVLLAAVAGPMVGMLAGLAIAGGVLIRLSQRRRAPGAPVGPADPGSVPTSMPTSVPTTRSAAPSGRDRTAAAR